MLPWSRLSAPGTFGQERPYRDFGDPPAAPGEHRAGRDLFRVAVPETERRKAPRAEAVPEAALIVVAERFQWNRGLHIHPGQRDGVAQVGGRRVVIVPPRVRGAVEVPHASHGSSGSPQEHMPPSRAGLQRATLVSAGPAGQVSTDGACQCSQPPQYQPASPAGRRRAGYSPPAQKPGQPTGGGRP